jgi:hypothetical protein
LPDGIEYWRPLSVPLLVVGLWNAAAWGRWPVALAGFSFMGVAGGTPLPLAAFAALLATALALELTWTMNLSPPLTALVRVAAWPVAAWAGVRVLQEVLLGEVVYTALCVVAPSGRRRRPWKGGGTGGHRLVDSAPGRDHIAD